MRTAVLVLAILGDVFGGIGALLAFVFGASIVGLSGGAAGRGAATGALLAFGAVVVGIIATAIAVRHPRIAGLLCIAVAIVGTAGTFAFALGSLLFLIAGGLALFATPQTRALTQAPTSLILGSEPPIAATERPHALRRLPRVSRRWIVATTAAIVVVGAASSLAFAQPAEHKPVRALLEALNHADDLTIADLLAPGLRAGSAARDSEQVLAYALGRSEIGFLNADWLRRLGPATGTRMAFEGLTLTTTAKIGDIAVVHVRGLFAPVNDNGFLQQLLQGLRQPFDADVRVANVDGTWFIATTEGTTVRALPTAIDARLATPAPPPAAIAAPTRTAPIATVAPTATAVRHLVLGTFSPAPTPTVADLNGWKLALRDITVGSDESVLFEFELTVGSVDGPWASRESRLELRNGLWLNVLSNRSMFYDGGKGPGAVVGVALAFGPGLAGNQPYLLRVCGNLGYCWSPLPGPAIGER